MNIYFELSESVKHDLDGRYFVAYGSSMDDVRNTTRHLGLMLNSDRAWEESENGVRFVKNKLLGFKTAEVDMKEFFWIKLKSVKV
jgi:hypothetical protein